MLILFQKMGKLWANNKNKIIKIISLIILISIIVFLYILFNKKESELNYMDCSNKNNVPRVIIDLDEPLKEKLETEEKIINGYPYNVFSVYEKTNATFKLIDNCNNNNLEEKIKISYRGQSSLILKKKQYSITFYDKSLEKNVSILNMPPGAKFALNGTLTDKTVLRNYLAYHMASQIMEYAPKTRYVDVYIKNNNEELNDSHYMGLYLIIEKIEQDENRVNIRKFNEKYNDISFIIARDKIKSNDLVYSTSWQELDAGFIFRGKNKSSRTVIKAVYPSSGKVTENYQMKIEEYVNNFETALYGIDFKDKNKGYQNYIDVNSFIEYEMINEIFKNIDGGEVSTFFYKDIGGKLKAGPVWDFDLSSGNTDDDGMNEYSGFSTNNTIWFERLFQDPYFTKRYISRYIHYRRTIWTDEKISEMIDNVVTLIDESAKKNTEKWYKNVSYEEEVDDLKQFLIDRLNWLDNNIRAISRYES